MSSESERTRAVLSVGSEMAIEPSGHSSKLLARRAFGAALEMAIKEQRRKGELNGGLNYSSKFKRVLMSESG